MSSVQVLVEQIALLVLEHLSMCANQNSPARPQPLTAWLSAALQPWITADIHNQISSRATNFDINILIYFQLGPLHPQSPYYIVEFKPALGWLFREYLGEYSHWAYGDLDVLFGDMRNGWLEPEELKRFDIITFR